MKVTKVRVTKEFQGPWGWVTSAKLDLMDFEMLETGVIKCTSRDPKEKGHLLLSPVFWSSCVAVEEEPPKKAKFPGKTGK